MDFTVGSKKLRSIAAYAPHAGYSADDFNAFFGQVHAVILGACKDGRQTILSGDFNLQLQVGNHGEQIDALANAFGLTMANDDEHHSLAAETWTFCTSMGVTRRIDFILCSSSLPLAASHPSCLQHHTLHVCWTLVRIIGLYTQGCNSERHVETRWTVHVVQNEVGRQSWMEQESQHRIIKF